MAAPVYLRVPLIKGCGFTIVDECDEEIVTGRRWRLVSEGRYAMSRHDMLHRLILPPPPGLVIDHVNGDGLDNRRVNLRLVTPAQNNQNQHKARSNTGVRGVSWLADKQRFFAHIRHEGKTRALGKFKTLEEARQAVEHARATLMTHAPESDPELLRRVMLPENATFRDMPLAKRRHSGTTTGIRHAALLFTPELCAARSQKAAQTRLERYGSRGFQTYEQNVERGKRAAQTLKERYGADIHAKLAKQRAKRVYPREETGCEAIILPAASVARIEVVSSERGER